MHGLGLFVHILLQTKLFTNKSMTMHIWLSISTLLQNLIVIRVIGVESEGEDAIYTIAPHCMMLGTMANRIV